MFFQYTGFWLLRPISKHFVSIFIQIFKYHSSYLFHGFFNLIMLFYEWKSFLKVGQVVKNPNNIVTMYE